MTLSYESQRQRWKRYGFTVIAVAVAIYIWIIQLGAASWWARVFSLGFALWSLRFLIDYRACIDVASGTFTREKLLFGRYLVDAVRFPLSEFTGVALDRYDRSEDSTTTFYVCLRRRSGRLIQVCRFEVQNGERSDGAEKVARELAELTRLKYETAA